MKWILAAAAVFAATPSFASVSFNGDQVYSLAGHVTAPGNALYLIVSGSFVYNVSGSVTATNAAIEQGIYPRFDFEVSGTYNAQELNWKVSPDRTFYFSYGPNGQAVNFSFSSNSPTFNMFFDSDGLPGDLRLVSSAKVSPVDLGAFGLVVNSYDLTFESGEVSISYAEAPLPVPSVPEPSTWAMMIAGLGMTGVGLRYRRRRSTIAFA